MMGNRSTAVRGTDIDEISKSSEMKNGLKKKKQSKKCYTTSNTITFKNCLGECFFNVLH